MKYLILSLFVNEYNLAKKAKERLSGPPETATAKFSFIIRDFSNLL
jgi:hypothetical protein